MAQTIEECIDQNTVNQYEMIKDVFLGWATNKVSILGREDLIVEGLNTISSRAKYFTINIGDIRIGPDYRKEQLFVELYRNNNFEVFVHDPTFFTLNFNPVAFSVLSRLVLVNKSASHYYPMVMTEVKELDLPQDPCNEDEKYHFQVFILLSSRHATGRYRRRASWGASAQAVASK